MDKSSSPEKDSQTALRSLLPSDLDFAHGLSRLAGWNQTEGDWERFLALGPGGCFLAEWGGMPAGTATTTCYGTGLAWIGMVLVHPDFRRKGLGTALLRGAVRHLREDRGVACVRLDATPEGQPLYESLGFQAEWSLRRWVRDAEHEGGESDRPDETGEGSGDDARVGIELFECSRELDREVFGEDRFALLRSLAAEPLVGGTLDDGSFGLAREGERANYLGPVTAASEASGLTLVDALIRRCSRGRALYWDLPDQNRAATKRAADLGFRPVRELTRMWLGEYPAPCDPARIFGLAEPGLG